MAFARAILERQGSIQDIRKRTFIETIYLQKAPEHNNFCVKGNFFRKNSEWQHLVLNTETFLGCST